MVNRLLFHFGVGSVAMYGSWRSDVIQILFAVLVVLSMFHGRPKKSLPQWVESQREIFLKASFFSSCRTYFRVMSCSKYLNSPVFCYNSKTFWHILELWNHTGIWHIGITQNLRLKPGLYLCEQRKQAMHAGGRCWMSIYIMHMRCMPNAISPSHLGPGLQTESNG